MKFNEKILLKFHPQSEVCKKKKIKSTEVRLTRKNFEIFHLRKNFNGLNIVQLT